MSEGIDEFHGQGGSFVINPATGKRELVERTEEAPAVVTNPVENGDGTTEA